MPDNNFDKPLWNKINAVDHEQKSTAYDCHQLKLKSGENDTQHQQFNGDIGVMMEKISILEAELSSLSEYVQSKSIATDELLKQLIEQAEME